MLFKKNRNGNSELSTEANKISKNKKCKRIRRSNSAQGTIPITNIYEDGIIETKKGEYSKTLQFIDINYHIAREDDQIDIFAKYCEFLNFFNSSVKLQITINNKPINKEEFEGKIVLKQKNDHLDIYRKEYNEMLKKQVTKGRNDIEKEKYITISIKANDVIEARNNFIRIENEILGLLRRMGSYGKVLPISKRLEILHDVYRKDNIGNFEYNPKVLKQRFSNVKDVIAPDSFEFKRDNISIGDSHARVLFIRSLPSFLSDSFLTELTDFGFNMMFSMNINPVEPEFALKLIQKQITGMESNKIEYQRKSVKNGYLDAFIPYELKNNLQEAEELLEDVMNKNQRLFLVNFIILLTEDDKDALDEHTEIIKSAARKYLCQIGSLNYQQEEGLNSVLPLGINDIQVDRCLTTEATAVFIPFTSQELLHPHGMYYGLNAISKSLIMFDRKTLKNQNGFILGTPGSGKSFSAKREMINVLLNTDDDVLIIDPEREYSNLVKNFGGEIINISSNSRRYINPMDMSTNYDEEPLSFKSDFIISLCEVILGGKNGLSAKEKSIIDRCVRLTYQDYIQNFKEEDIPTLIDFYKTVKQQKEPEAEGLSIALELYATGNLSVFSHKTNININNRLVCFDIKDLGKQLKTMGMLIILDQVWNRITENRKKGKHTWIYLDEIYLLFANEYSANFLFELYKRSRKWGGVVTGITQNVEDLLQSELARRMLSNSDFILMLNQAPMDRVELEKMLNISAAQLTYITNTDSGRGLLFSGNSIIPFIDEFPKDTELYRMMTTKVGEVVDV
ncbi:VirB4-like conjugal transfer ATPase, CD1110 family [Sedimentibacter sp. MB31-C6]|uniref:VirB4-like conjugal transfer ATPase, CD1110 family n=1 Tax=Sedimentibacter sp. MB31-C6 TaxID=3109366 RepID=UPI002DDDAE7A|nr:ATP-binding protein [Sedimentibacter sp. MB36-C1]WSI05113.1 ATP-binding protein [Sedimentibacter sp. MB36-C1]